MKLLVHDYAGYAFSIQLARALAARGHEVTYAFSAEFAAPHPHGPLSPAPGDPANFRILPVTTGQALKKYDLVHRWRQDRAYGRELTGAVIEARPDVVISADTPLDSQARAQRAYARHGIRTVLWWQDIYSYAIASVLGQRLPAPAASMIARYYRRKEADLLEHADAVVAISDAFLDEGRAMGARLDRHYVVPNWAPINDLPVMPKDNPWSRAHQLHDRKVVLYSGTLGYKHNPDLLIRLADALYERDRAARLVVVSQGIGADHLRAEQARRPVPALQVLDFQAYADLPCVLGSADLLIGILEPAAARFSVPSKLLAYLCAGRPVLLGVPATNAASALLRAAGAGAVVDPTAGDEFVGRALELLASPNAAELGAKARAFAERTFRIEHVSARFEEIATHVLN